MVLWLKQRLKKEGMALQSCPIKEKFKLRQQIDQRNIENKVWHCGSSKRTFKAMYNAFVSR